ncbi:MAG: tungsten ABC transporter substrate-binding protein [Proteobacteria bacterium]|nr:tungsten ABC transporter substrate-binding protein [Pseudomonadota bacterium]
MVFLLFLLFIMGSALSEGAEKILTISTTTSTQASGLLDILLPQLEEDTGIRVKVIAKGTGAAIRDGMDGNVDLIFVHAKERELKFISQGYGTKRYPVMHNDFVILGPPNDPAGVKGSGSVQEALRRVASNRSVFVSRGDDSGTHTKEQFLWKLTGLTTELQKREIIKKGKTKAISFIKPQGSWYHSIGQGMGATLTYADEKRAYTLADRGTFLKFTLGSIRQIDLIVVAEGDATLNNPYGVIPVNPKKFPHVKYALAKEFANWIVSPVGQSLIANYKLLGQPLFYPNVL